MKSAPASLTLSEDCLLSVQPFPNAACWIRRAVAACGVLAGGALLAAQVPVILPGSTAVGQQAAPINVPVTITAGGFSAAPVALTLGSPKLDYSLGAPSGANPCVGNVTYNQGDVCTVSVIFAPLYPGQRPGAVVLENSTGGPMGETLLNATATGALGIQVPGEITTVAGDDQWLYQGDGYAATSSSIFLPAGIAVDAAGNMYIADSSNNRIRYVAKKTGLMSTLAGDGTPSFSGDGLAATKATVNNPAGLALDGAGNLYFADTGNDVIRRVDAVTGIITTVAGMGGDQGYSGDNGAATAATLSLPEGIAFDAQQNLYIADTGNNVIRRVDAVTGMITTFAGNGGAGYNGDNIPAISASFHSPWSVSVGPDGGLYIADMQNNRIRKVSTAGIVTTVAGNGVLSFSGDGGPPTAAGLNEPASALLDPAGDIYIADSGNNRIREVSVATGEIDTIAGTDGEQFVGDDGPAIKANLYGPGAMFFDQTGDLFLTDMFHNRVREVAASGLTLTYPAMRVGKVSAPQIEAIENVGNSSMTLTAPGFDNTALAPSTTTCNTGDVLALGASCNLGVEFAPTVLGNDVTGQLTTNSNAANTPNIIYASGEVLSVNPTSTTVASSLNPSMYGNLVTFTATVSSGGTSLTGTVTILDGSVTVCAASVNSNGVASCSTSALALGSHSITASYGGDASDASSVSSALIQVVKQPSTVALTASPNPAVVTASVTLTATVTAPSGTPTGAVTFYDGTTAIGSANLSTSGVASFSTTQLTAATHSITAQYGGDTNDAVGTSNTVQQVVNLASTITTLGSSNTDVSVGTTITFTANVSTTDGPAPTGTVQFTDGATVLGSNVVGNTGIATLMIATLAPGTHKIVATYSGDSDDATSVSTALVQTVEQIGTVTAVSSTSNPANAGASVQLNANVAIVAGATADGAITGKVTFSNGATTLGTVVVDANGNASLTLNNLPVGADGIVASYAGNTDYAASTSASFTQTINQTSTTTVVSSNNQSAYSGKSVTFSATVTTATGTATGAVTFYANGKSIGTGALNAGGVATLTVTTLPTGPLQITAVYAGDSNYTTSTSAPYPETISLAAPAVMLAGPVSPVNAGIAVTLTGTIASEGVTPTGALTLLDGTKAIATQNAAADGSFSFAGLSLAVGTHSLSVSYAGDSNNAAATSNGFTLTVQQAPTTTSLASSMNPQVLGQPVTLTAAVSSVSPNASGTIVFYDGASVLSSVNVGTSGNAVYTTSSLTFGTHTLTAVYSGDTNHATSTSQAVSELIVQSATATLTSSLNPSVAGTPVTFTLKLAAVDGVIPTGSVVFTDGANSIGTATLDATGTATLQTSALSVASHEITASYAGDKNYSSTSASLIQTVQNANTQVALTSSASPATYQTPVTLTAAVTSNGGTATGSVSFTDGGASIGSALLNANGVATLTLSSLTPGTHSIVANYAGDGKASASVSNPLTVVVKETTTVALASNANPTPTLSPITLTATIANSGVGAITGNVIFSDGSTQLGTVAVGANGVATLTVPSLAAGSHSIIASYLGDGDNFSSISATMVQTISLRSTTTTLTATETNINNTQQVTLISVERWTGSTAPTGTVTFMNGSKIIGTSPVDGTGVATLTIVLQSTSASFTAIYSGDPVYAGSTSASVSVTTGQPVDFTMSLNPSSLSLSSGQHGTATLTITSIAPFADTLQLGCVGLPQAASCTFTTTQAKLASGGTTTVNIVVDTGDPLGSGAESASIAKRSNGVMICFLPAGLLAGLLLFPKRRKSVAGLLVVVCAILVSLGATGCAGLTVNSTPAGSYTFQVTAVGQQSGVSVAQTMSLTVK
jgi:sugar lactone lactonase YvrE